ncbi:MAG: WecB/TagA/CpsF family glycosyltransferase [Patescibacteria group bacterium]|nr:WecB/TagA/CpsF family glycosyltransferase [Patescibacteria group bacterium]
MKRYFLEVKLDDTSKEDATEKVVGFLFGEKQNMIFTPNPEMIVKAQKDLYFKEVLNKGDLNLCDGAGLALATGIKRIPGVDFMMEICKIAEKKNKSVYLLGTGDDKIIKKTADNLIKSFPKLRVVGFDIGPEIEESGVNNYELRIINNDAIVEKINKVMPDVLFVAFGMGKQEKWINENLRKLPSVKMAMGVGGAFDYISGVIPRAPLFLRRIGLEWLYRMIRQPNRIGRIFNATVVFIFFLIKNKFKK